MLGADGKKYKLYGPKNIVFDAANAIGNDPSWYTDDEKRKQTLMYLHQNGVIAIPVEAGKPEEAPKTRTYEDKEFKVTEEWKNGKWSEVGRSKIDKKPLAEVNVKVGEKGMTKLAEEMGKDLVVQRKDVEGSALALRNIYDAKALMDSGMITGVGANFLTDVGNLLSSRLGFTAFSDPVKNTEAYAAIVGMQVGQIIKQFGSGTGLSDADREFAKQIVAGDVTLTEKSLRRIININIKGHQNVINDFNKKALQVQKKEGADQLPYDLLVDMPTASNLSPETKTVNGMQFEKVEGGWKRTK